MSINRNSRGNNAYRMTFEHREREIKSLPTVKRSFRSNL